MRATNPELQLQVESLEPRMMLSTVEIIAAGTTNQEIIELEIGGQTVASFSQLGTGANDCLLYTSPSPRDATLSRMPSSA